MCLSLSFYFLILPVQKSFHSRIKASPQTRPILKRRSHIFLRKMEIKECADERWALLINSTENSVETPEDGGGREEEDDDIEALSLCDLPLIHQSRKENEENGSPLRAAETDQEDFDFCSLSKESEMCAADEVFYQGQILPLRRSMSCRNGFLQYCVNSSRSISRSESMDHYLISSRSSSIGSHQSSSSGSSTATTDPKLPPRNQFHSHPSPSPRQGMVKNNYNRNWAKKSSAWNVFRLGLFTAPREIAFHDLKTRCPSNTNSKNLGRCSSNSSSSSDKKKIFKPWDFLGGCKCLVDAADTVPSKLVIIKRSASDSESQRRALQVQAEEENLLAIKSPKKRLSNHRTFEWLKQLSLEGTADEP